MCNNGSTEGHNVYVIVAQQRCLLCFEGWLKIRAQCMCNCGTAEGPNARTTVAKHTGIPRKPWIRSEMFISESLVEGQCHV
jgi:hypothetical protein